MQHRYVFLAAALLAGCSHSSTMQLSADTMQIATSAAPACGMAGAQGVAVRTAAIETIKHGFDGFVILGGQAQNNVGVVGYTPTYAQTNATVNAYGGNGYAMAYGQSNTMISGGHPIIAGTHDQVLMVKMFKAGDPGAENAVSARATLGPDWKQRLSEGSLSTCG